MKKITYLELLQMVKEGKAPLKIEVDGETYEYFEQNGGARYYSKVDDCFLYMQNVLKAVSVPLITCKEPVLTDKEREYLKAVIKPWRDKITGMGIVFFIDREYLKINLSHGRESVPFPFFPIGKYYKGMERGKEYTLEELDL